MRFALVSLFQPLRGLPDSFEVFQCCSSTSTLPLKAIPESESLCWKKVSTARWTSRLHNQEKRKGAVPRHLHTRFVSFLFNVVVCSSDRHFSPDVFKAKRHEVKQDKLRRSTTAYRRRNRARYVSRRGKRWSSSIQSREGHKAFNASLSPRFNLTWPQAQGAYNRSILSKALAPQETEAK